MFMLPKAAQRAALIRKYAKGQLRLSDFTLAAANAIKGQGLNVDGVDILEHEINSDN